MALILRKGLALLATRKRSSVEGRGEVSLSSLPRKGPLRRGRERSLSSLTRKRSSAEGWREVSLSSLPGKGPLRRGGERSLSPRYPEKDLCGGAGRGLSLLATRKRTSAEGWGEVSLSSLPGKGPLWRGGERSLSPRYPEKDLCGGVGGGLSLLANPENVLCGGAGRGLSLLATRKRTSAEGWGEVSLSSLPGKRPLRRGGERSLSPRYPEKVLCCGGAGRGLSLLATQNQKVLCGGAGSFQATPPLSAWGAHYPSSGEPTL